MSIRNFILSGTALLLAGTASAQPRAIPETAWGADGPAWGKVVREYLDSVGIQAAPYVGIKESAYSGIYQNTPYYGGPRMREGCLWFGDRAYPGVRMRYDRFQERVVLESRDGVVNLVLPSDRVRQFTLEDKLFIHYPGDTLPGAPPKGFYLLLYDGRLKLMMAPRINRQEKVVDGKFKYVFLPQDEYYLYKDGVYHAVSGKGSLLKVLKDRKKELSAYIRQEESLDFYDRRGESLAACAAYYDNLNPK